MTFACLSIFCDSRALRRESLIRNHLNPLPRAGHYPIYNQHRYAMLTLSYVNSVQITFVQYMQRFRLNAEIFLIDQSDQIPNSQGWGGGG
jgi:hypothetical protein